MSNKRIEEIEAQMRAEIEKRINTRLLNDCLDRMGNHKDPDILKIVLAEMTKDGWRKAHRIRDPGHSYGKYLSSMTVNRDISRSFQMEVELHWFLREVNMSHAQFLDAFSTKFALWVKTIKEVENIIGE